MFYEVLCLFSSFQTFIVIGYMIQIGDYGIHPGITLGFVSLFLIFYAVAVYYSFQTYREFKALHFEQLGEVEGFRLGKNYSVNNVNYGSNHAEDQRRKDFDEFRGQSVRLGDY